MSRSASDATRFTATGPHAYSKPPPSAASAMPGWPGMKSRTSQTPQSSPGGSGGTQETPKEKVERLRAEARTARIKKSSSPFDRFLSRGRTWADRLHRVAVLSLIAASGAAGILTIYSMSSLIKHNRNQRALWIDKEMQRLMDAKTAYIQGTATTEQLTLLEQEKAGEQERQWREEQKKEGYTYKARQWMFGGLKKEEADAAETLNVERASVVEAVDAKRAETLTPPEAPSEQGADGKQGGSGSKWSWTGWVTGR